MLFRRLYHDALAQASYLIGCQESREAVVVDPLRDPAPYLEAARQEGLRITQVTETHVHADFLSGAAALAEAAGAQLVLSGEGAGQGADDVIYHRATCPPARWVRDGDVIQVGRVRLDVLHVPGHTPEHIAFVVTDEATSAQPVGLLSGDFLFVGDVGRPDLLERAVGAAGTMEGSARRLYASLQRIRALPEFLQVWPGHGAGSACGKALGAVPQSTLGYELRANWAFAAKDEAAFVREVLAGQPEPPRYFARMKRLNADGGMAPPPARPEAPADRVTMSRAQLVDVRPPAAFAAGHVHGAINIPLGKSFLEWAGTVLDPMLDLVVFATPENRRAAEAAVHSLQLIGIDGAHVVMAPADFPRLAGDQLETLHTVPASALGARAEGRATVVDVRRRSEWEAGHVPGAVHLPLAELPARLEELRGRGPLLVHCQGGSRSAVAASVLLAAGFDDVSNVEGGFGAWVREGHVPATGA